MSVNNDDTTCRKLEILSMEDVSRRADEQYSVIGSTGYRHTGGRWIFEKETGQEFTAIGGPIATVGGPGNGEAVEYTVGVISDYGPEGEATTEANAKLITAAPALALAWHMVPDDMKEDVLTKLEGVRVDWVRPAIQLIKGDK